MTRPELSTPFVAAPPNQQAGTSGMRSSADVARDGRGTETAKQAMLAQRQALLGGPVLAVMLKLALPTVIVLVVQSFVGVAKGGLFAPAIQEPLAAAGQLVTYQTGDQIDRRHGLGLRLAQSGLQHGGSAAEPELS